MAPVGHLMTWFIASAWVNSLRLPIQNLASLMAMCCTPFYRNAPAVRISFALSIGPPAQLRVRGLLIRHPNPEHGLSTAAATPFAPCRPSVVRLRYHRLPRRNRPEHLAV